MSMFHIKIDRLQTHSKQTKFTKLNLCTSNLTFQKQTQPNQIKFNSTKQNKTYSKQTEFDQTKSNNQMTKIKKKL